MNKCCTACADSKLRCDLKIADQTCTRCRQKGLSCVRAERKKRARRSRGISSIPSPQTGSEDGPYQVADLASFNESPIDLSLFEGSSPDDDDFLAQLAELENSVYLSSFTWNPHDFPSIMGNPTVSQNDIGTPTYGVVTPDTAMRAGFLCPDNFRLPADFTLELGNSKGIPVYRLEKYARLFFDHFHSFFPILHIPTFCLASSTSTLIRSILIIGAGLDSDPTSKSDAKAFYSSLPSMLAKCCLHSDRIPPKLEELQALVLFQFASMVNEGSAERAASRLLHPLLVATIRQAGFLKVHGECTKATRNAHAWESWIHNESRKRVLWGVFSVDCYQSILCGSKPLLLPTDTRASFPCDDSSWNACSASLWAALPAQDPTSCFLSSVKGLMAGQAPSQSNITEFGMNLLIMAVHSLLLEAQTSILPVDISVLEKALHTWYASWEELREHSQRHYEPTTGGPIITNSLSLYYLGMHFLRHGRPVLDDSAYMERSKDAGNPLIIREQVYRDEMTRCVREMLDEFRKGGYTTAVF
ncbi:uncharacterized protein N7503_011999 [Penicillium pulvis]|uniref:uncharacterized protein n=1 Tax=Penicillium pulvis TaxID=1562058 RepID=UPI0025497603|nr:uncharacterized protein N7503_011999 [Penicillium pulvis]KAJ5786787.1 hypothetical protein N7503_011999 [Penicillium pulvis]